ncbi:MAG: glycosyltransferase family 9 protein [Candidatus Kryptoniota bacterium]
MKILIIALPGIGDALLVTPAIALTKRFIPESRIDVMVMFKGAEEIFKRDKNVDVVHYFDFIKEGLFRSLRFVLELRGKYDATVNIYPSNRREYNVINFLIGAKKRAAVMYLRKNLRNLGFLNNIRITENDQMHNVQENINLFAELLGTEFSEEPDLEFPLTEDEREYAKVFCEQIGIASDKVVIGFHPGGSTLKNHVHKRWHPDKYSELGDMLIEELGARVLIFGGHEERALRDQIAKKIGSPFATGVNTKTFGQSAALIERCDVFISNDSSLLHLAAALKRKTVLITGPINPVYTRPWNTDYRIASLYLDCSPCFIYSPRPLTCSRSDVKFMCLKELAVKTVYQKTVQLLDHDS